MAIIGLEKLFYSKITKDDETGATFGAPIYLAGVKEIKISPKVSTEKLYAENKLWEQATALDNIEVSINIADLSNAELADLVGHTVTSEGGIVAASGDTAPYIAIMYKANKSNGKNRYGILYKGKLELPEDTAKGAEGKTDFQTPEVKATFQPLQYNDAWKYQVDSDDPAAPVDIDTTFFNAVTVAGADVAVPTVTSVPLDAATGVATSANVVFTFSKAVSAGTVNASNVFLMKADGTAVPAVLSLDATSKIITLDPSSALSTGAHVAVCTTGVKSVAGIPAASNTIVNFTV